MWGHVVTITSAICGVHPEHSRPKPVIQILSVSWKPRRSNHH
jgi:hypothetical protein